MVRPLLTMMMIFQGLAKCLWVLMLVHKGVYLPVLVCKAEEQNKAWTLYRNINVETLGLGDFLQTSSSLVDQAVQGWACQARTPVFEVER